MHRLSDLALPGLAVALDREAMHASLAGAAGCTPAALARCDIERVKYRPGRSALVLYRVSIAEAGDVREALFYATVYPSGITLHAFPDDRKLPGLRVLGDGERLRAELLPELARVGWGKPSELPASRASRVSYFPEHSYTLRVTLRGSAGHECTVYGKTQAGGAGAGTLATMRALWQSRAEREEHLTHAQPLLYQERACALWQEALCGSTLEALAAQSPLPGTLAARVGKAVAALHGARMDGLPPIDARACLARLGDVVRALAAALPDAAAPARKVVEQLARELPETASEPATLHGDLHLNNILVQPDRIGLIDLDDVRAGPAEMELGSFVAALAYRALLHGEQRLPRETVGHFLQGYQAVARRPLRPAQVRWHAAAALIHERAWRCLTSLKPGRLGLIDELIALAGAVMARPCWI